MSNHVKTIIWRFFIALAILMVIAQLFSCASVKQRRAERFYSKHPDKAAAYFAKKFPVVVSVDSTGYLQSVGELDSLLKSGPTMPWNLPKLTINPNVGYVVDDGPAPVADAPPDYKQHLAQIRKAVANLKPIIVIKPDSAALAALRAQMNRDIQTLNQKIAGKDAAYNKLQGKHSVVRKWLLGVVVLVVVYVVLKTKRIIPI